MLRQPPTRLSGKGARLRSGRSTGVRYASGTPGKGVLAEGGLGMSKIVLRVACILFSLGLADPIGQVQLVLVLLVVRGALSAGLGDVEGA